MQMMVSNRIKDGLGEERKKHREQTVLRSEQVGQKWFEWEHGESSANFKITDQDADINERY